MSWLKGEGVEQLRHPRADGAGRRRAAIAADDAGASAHAGQHATGRAHRRYPARGDRRRQADISVSSSRSQTWHVYAFAGLDNLGSSAVGPWQSYATAAYNSMIAPGDTLALNLATTPGDPRQLRFARLSYDTPIGRRRAAGRRLRPLQRSVARRLAAAVCRQHQDRGVRTARQHCADACRRNRRLTLTMAAGFSNVSEHDIFGPIYLDAIRTISLNADYRLQDNFGGTNFLTVNWRQGLRHPRRFRQKRSLDFGVGRFTEILRAEFLVHALPDPHRCMVAQACIGWSDGLGPDVPVAAILSRRSRLRPRLWRRRDQRRQRDRRLA